MVVLTIITSVFCFCINKTVVLNFLEYLYSYSLLHLSNSYFLCAMLCLCLSFIISSYYEITFFQNEDDMGVGNMEENDDGEMADIEALNYDDLDSVSKLQKTQRYIDIMQVISFLFIDSIFILCMLHGISSS